MRMHLCPLELGLFVLGATLVSYSIWLGIAEDLLFPSAPVSPERAKRAEEAMVHPHQSEPLASNVYRITDAPRLRRVVPQTRTLSLN